MGCFCGDDVVELKPSGLPIQVKKEDAEQVEVSEVYKREIVKAKPKAFSKKKWIANVQAPASYDPNEIPTQVRASLELEAVYGYRSRKARNNLFKVGTDDVLYPAAGVGVLHNKKTNMQKFMIGHTDDIISLTYHASSGYVATGELGKTPKIHLWNTSSDSDSTSIPSTASVDTGKVRGITALSFSHDAEYLIGVGMDSNHTVFLYRCEGGNASLVTSQDGHSSIILDVESSPTEKKFVTVGANHVKFWSYVDGNLESNTGLFGDSSLIQTMLSVNYAPDNTVVTGSMNGKVYFWGERELDSISEAAHDGAIHAICRHPGGFITGGADGKIVFWEGKMNQSSLDLQELCSESLDFAIRSMDYKGEGSILVGLQDSTILEVDHETKTVKIIARGHSAINNHEIWGLCVKKQNPDHFISAGDDQTIRVWSASERSMVVSAKLNDKLRCCDYHPTKDVLVAGTMSGSVNVLNGEDLTSMYDFQAGDQEISDVKFSPNGEYLAVASHDQRIYVYGMSQEPCELVNTCKGHSSYITHIDWSKDSTMLQSSSGDRELLYWDAMEGKQVTKSDEYKDVEWDTFTCVLGWPMSGIWQSGMDVTDVNAAATEMGHGIIASGNDFGQVVLSNYPSNKDQCDVFIGHSSHVTNVRFAHNGNKLLSTGGMDSCIFQWAVKKN